MISAKRICTKSVGMICIKHITNLLLCAIGVRGMRSENGADLLKLGQLVVDDCHARMDSNSCMVHLNRPSVSPTCNGEVSVHLGAMPKLTDVATYVDTPRIL